MSLYIDPVCGMSVDPATAAGRFEYEGRDYYFCNPHCMQKFKADPQAYLNRAPQPMAPRPVQLRGKSQSLPIITPRQTEQTTITHTDPVCGMTVAPETAAGSYEHNSKTYYFCSTHCLNKFKADPAAFLHPSPKPQPQVPAGAKYICPMDPEVVSDKPGACPKCGMALEPEMPAVPMTKTEYTCPMHPEIVREEPGSCPICGHGAGTTHRHTGRSA